MTSSFTQYASNKETNYSPSSPRYTVRIAPAVTAFYTSTYSSLLNIFKVLHVFIANHHFFLRILNEWAVRKILYCDVLLPLPSINNIILYTVYGYNVHVSAPVSYNWPRRAQTQVPKCIPQANGEFIYLKNLTHHSYYTFTPYHHCWSVVKNCVILVMCQKRLISNYKNPLY
jgi:hypothetical protein